MDALVANEVPTGLQQEMSAQLCSDSAAELAFAIADAAARASVESLCSRVRLRGEVDWWDLSSVNQFLPATAGPDSPRAIIGRAVRYLRVRGLAVAHATYPTLISFSPALVSA